MMQDIEKVVEDGSSIEVVIRPPGFMGELEMVEETRKGDRLQGCGVTTAALAQAGEIPTLQLMRTRSISASAGAPSRSPVAQRTVVVERVRGAPPDTAGSLDESRRSSVERRSAPGTLVTPDARVPANRVLPGGFSEHHLGKRVRLGETC